MPSQLTILFIDDETHFATNYVEALREYGFKVLFYDTASEGLEYLRTNCLKIDLLVLDIQMPTPVGVSITETKDGLDTGIWLLGEARDLLEENQLPTLVLSNRAKIALEQAILERVLFDPPKLVRVTTKTATSAKKLPPLVADILGEFGK
jgi:CheY-like chemotaxis protein